MNWNAWADDCLARLERQQRRRYLKTFEGAGIEGWVDGRTVISFASNDYFGLSTHPVVRRAAIEATERWGTGTGSARLVAGTRALHEELETTLACWKHTESALVFASGYATNVGVIAALGDPDVTIFSDALNHASIIDGCRLSKAHTVVYPHLDLDALEAALARTPGRKIVVSDTVFSMDGDCVDEGALVALCARHAALLILDDAHAALSSARTEHGAEVLRIGTLSKMLGSMGGFVCGPRALIELIVNRARTFLFSTALSPAATAAALAATRICMSAEGASLRATLRSRIERLRPGHPTPIVPIHCGTDAAAVTASRCLLQEGLYVPAIRPPTVPKGTARLRIALTASHADAMIDRLRAALAALRHELDVCDRVSSLA